VNPSNSSNQGNPSKHVILLTIDVEDWFQVENLRFRCPTSSWASYELRVEKNVHRLLDLFDEISNQRSAEKPTTDNQPITDNFEQRKVRATFFILGWVAERLPNLVREIHSRGHEVASHGFFHELCTDVSRIELRRDLLDSKKLLEDTIGTRVYGYRAPSFSVSEDALAIIEECEFTYDSSYNSFAMNKRYGKISLIGGQQRGIAILLNHHSTVGSRNLYELPISNLKFAGRVFPWGGGGYFRFLPYTIYQIGVKHIIAKEDAYLFYMHPWEIDPEQPRVRDLPASHKFRHYVNLDKCYSKLSRFLRSLSCYHFVGCQHYLEEVAGANLGS
jgi:peptidoglycan-N-acetylglucosamine deacetylase